MGNRILAATRKGLFVIERTGQGNMPWTIARTAFLAEHIIMTLPDARDGSLYAAIYSQHFGGKLHRSTDGGATW